ncbi:MAG: prepilin-type N-terminal cleavage/methylation domain-containing protein [Candidatus Yanofskybacteria bacterium]|nr:prepilin-type N-terminal cleavage/methylation domain-containing protein [Candidatus Yanofskybacteria bacterium]
MKNFQFSIFNFQNKNKKEAGFTVVEVLVTSLIFSIIAMTVSAIFIQIINLERRSFAVQKIQDNALLVLEEISRDVRVSRISDQESLDCTAATITLIHPLKGTVVYRTSNGIVQRNINGGSYDDVSNSNVNFTRMNFCIRGSSANDNQSPRVSIITSVQNRTGREVLQINLQTTTTSRNFVDEFQFP